MGVPGPGGPKGPTLPPTNTSQENVTTVKTGETTLKQVADRLGGGITEEALRIANPQIKNPNQLQAGMDIHLPHKPQTSSDSSSPQSHKPTSNKSGGFSPSIRKGNWEISGTIKGSTSSVVDGEGSTEARRAKREQLHGMKPPDERDIDPATIKKEKDLKRENELKAGDPVMKDINKQSQRGKEQIETGNAYEREMRQKLLDQQKGRLQNPQNIPTTDKK